jgi:hypothetical protein
MTKSLVLWLLFFCIWFGLSNQVFAQPEDYELQFSTYFGGSGWETVREVAFDDQNNILVVGNTQSSAELLQQFPGTKVIGSLGQDDVFVAKFSSDGSSLMWLTLVGGSGRDRGYGVELDNNGDIYVAGRTSSTNFPVTAGAYDESHNGGVNDVHGPSDAFVFKLRADGQHIIYSTFLGGSNQDSARGGLGIDAQGNAYVVGSTYSSDYLQELARPEKGNSYLGGANDAFITKVSPDGSSIEYSRFLGGSSGCISGCDPEEIRGVRVDDQGYAHVFGHVRSDDAMVTNSSSLNGTQDMYVAKISPDGQNLIYATYFGGSDGESLEHRMALDEQGSVYLVGATSSGDFPIFDDYQYLGPAGVSNFTGFIVKIDATGQPVFSTLLNNVGGTFGPGVDSQGNVVVGGTVYSSPTDDNDAYVRVYDQSGKSLLFSDLLSGSAWDGSRFATFDLYGNVVVIGDTTSTDFPTTLGAFDRSYSGNADAFIAKYRLVSWKQMLVDWLTSTGDQNGDGKVNSLDWGQQITGQQIPTTPSPTATLPPTPTLTPVPTLPPTSSGVPWGAFYTPMDDVIQYGMTATVTGEDLKGIDNKLAQARANGVKVIVTLGSVYECDYYQSQVFDYSKAYNDKYQAIQTLKQNVAGADNLKSYVDDGTLAAIRVFDEVHWDGSCGTQGANGVAYTAKDCRRGGISRTLYGMPIGTDSQPGFADLLHELKKLLPENTVVGSTSLPSYMALVVDRINLLRNRDSLPPMGDNSILALSGFQSRAKEDLSARAKFECETTDLQGKELTNIYFLGNRTSHYETNNYIWWQDYIDGCQASGMDIYASWCCNQASAATFRSRIEDLADGGVSYQGDTITLEDVQQTCGGL